MPRKVERLPIASIPDTRPQSELKDFALINALAEVNKSLDGNATLSVFKRPGVRVISTGVTAGATAFPKGLFQWNGRVYDAWGSFIYVLDATTYALLSTIAISSTSTSVGFTLCKNGADDNLFFCDGVSGWTVNLANTVTQITDPDFPTPHVPTPVYIDGYVFLAKQGTREIYNSDLEAPAAWQALNFISAEIDFDPIVALVAQKNQLIAIKKFTTEFFYDAANVSGSPLARNENLALRHGALDYRSVAVGRDRCMFIAQDASGSYYAVEINSLALNIISTPEINRDISTFTNIPTSLNILTATYVLVAGHLCYICNYYDSTFVYDFDSGLWSYFTRGIDSNISNTAFFKRRWDLANSAGLDPNDLVSIPDSNGVDTYFQIPGQPQLLGTLETSVYIDQYNVAGSSFKYIPVYIRTRPQDFGVMWNKQFYRIEPICDYSGVSNDNVWVSVSDDDYITYKVTRSIPLNGRSYRHRWGQGRRRAFLLQHSENAPFRCHGIEVELDYGVS